MLDLSYSMIEIFLIVIFGMLFVLLFYIQRYKYPIYYFNFGEIIYGIRTNIKPVAFIVRLLIILSYSFILSIFFKNCRVPVTATTFGAFLIVWPGFLHQDVIYSQVYRKRILLYFSYVIFILVALSGAFLGFQIFCLIEPLFKSYTVNILNIDRLFTLVVDGIIFFILVFVFRGIVKILDKEIKFGRGL